MFSVDSRCCRASPVLLSFVSVSCRPSFRDAPMYVSTLNGVYSFISSSFFLHFAGGASIIRSFFFFARRVRCSVGFFSGRYMFIDVSVVCVTSTFAAIAFVVSPGFLWSVAGSVRVAILLRRIPFPFFAARFPCLCLLTTVVPSFFLLYFRRRNVFSCQFHYDIVQVFRRRVCVEFVDNRVLILAWFNAQIIRIFAPPHSAATQYGSISTYRRGYVSRCIINRMVFNSWAIRGVRFGNKPKREATLLFIYSKAFKWHYIATRSRTLT